ncbi:MAG: hypothetical protein NTV24_03735 [Candidatus Woesebacteria bacterium]|nr:hypothetical protein [Candidatus Woesebacteria bacterium]
MRKTRKIGLLIEVLFLFVLLFIFTSKVLAGDNNQFVTVVNPVRISSYNKNPVESLKSEYDVIRKNSLQATWLLTFDVLDNPKMASLVKDMDVKQEAGIFLEITPDFAKNAGVIYHDTGFWHHAGSVFLSGYTQEERKLLIDRVFAKFKEMFGYYPSSVGSWGTDSYSLSYMKDKYEITANLVCSDQFATDGYQIWGQPWQVPYYSSRYHSAIFASTSEVKLGVVNIQWASRDPLNGYYSSLYSTQDYLVSGKNLDINYFEKLVRLYTNPKENGFGQITVGLEADLDPEGYKNEYAKQMDLVSRLKNTEGYDIVTMKDFADWYREKYPGLSPSSSFESDDLLGTGVKAVWLQSPEYRLFYTIDPGTQEIIVRDLRFYNAELEEPNYISPNRNFNLEINIPAVIDEVSFKEGIKKFKPKTNNIIEKFSKETLVVPFGGVLIKGLSSEAIHFFKQKKALIYLLTDKGWDYFKKVNYLIPQGEIYALNFLKKLPSGKVLIYNNECLQCEYHTSFKPPAFANLRNYVQKYSQHPIIYNKTVFEAKERREGRKDFKKTGVKYVYLVKFENYNEQLPFLPGDLGVEKIFSNANAEIWRVVK